MRGHEAKTVNKQTNKHEILPKIIMKTLMSDDKLMNSLLHIMESCEASKELRRQSDLSSDAGIVAFFKEVVHRLTKNTED